MHNASVVGIDLTLDQTLFFQRSQQRGNPARRDLQRGSQLRRRLRALELKLANNEWLALGITRHRLLHLRLLTPDHFHQLVKRLPLEAHASPRLIRCPSVMSR